ncbi:ATP-binding protein [Pseudoponticoccus marisrubri]|uniref:Histidine kinase/HSP90-like ATPase domain-containing protein n=1 Tax=Pseudoponticoccus marisrubri TaxID=1685382 RepID=A0A0W7WQE0_9RHOB|nr:ATP-binding protein [Pseudoponticoccus marisrubri]KUF12724.1 hypothetical protein AVJ23_03135 [Pseudoponticoccus marisrubri]
MQIETAPDGTLVLSSAIDSTPEAVRDLLARLTAALQARDALPPPDSMWELVLAEALNNIVEHAYGDRPAGRIALRIARGPGRLRVDIADHGRPMPGGRLPDERDADLTVAASDMPEGGFGWTLIRRLTEDLRYTRDGPVNRLRLSIRLTPPGQVS